MLTDPAAAGANAKCCVTLATSSGLQLNLEATTAESANSFLSGVNSVLTGNGMQVVLEDAKSAGETTSGKAIVNGAAAAGLPGSSRAAKRFSILGAPSLPGVNMSDPRAVAIANADGVSGQSGSSSSAAGSGSAGKQRTVLGVATHEAVAAMAEGRRFTRYSLDREGKPAKQTVTLFYVKDLHGQPMHPASLCSCSAVLCSAPLCYAAQSTRSMLMPSAVLSLCAFFVFLLFLCPLVFLLSCLCRCRVFPALFWCEPGTRVQSESSMMRLNDVCDVFLSELHTPLPHSQRARVCVGVLVLVLCHARALL